MGHNTEKNNHSSNNDLPNRRSIRLKGYDYAKPGVYFITICTDDRQCNFGRSENSTIKLSPIGKIAEKSWEKIPEHFRNVALDRYVIMPNHIHGIIVITDKTVSDIIRENKCRGVKFNAPTNNKSQYFSEGCNDKHIDNVGVQNFEPLRTNEIKKNRRGVKFNAPTNNKSQYYSQISPKSGSLPVIIRTFKSSVTRWCKNNGFKNFRWQRNFYDRIIRNEKELLQIRQYIINNLLQWHLDHENPKIRQSQQRRSNE